MHYIQAQRHMNLMKVLLRRGKNRPKRKNTIESHFYKVKREREREHALKYIFRSQDSDMSGEER